MNMYDNKYNAHSSGNFTEKGDAQYSYGGYKGIQSSSLAASASRIHSGGKHTRKYKGGTCGLCNVGLLGGKTRRKRCHCGCHKGKICKQKKCPCVCHIRRGGRSHKMNSHKRCHCGCHKGKICKQKNCPCICHKYESQFGGAGYTMPGYDLSAENLNQANPTPFTPYK